MVGSRRIPRLPGMRDAGARDLQRISNAVDAVGDCFRDKGYERIDTPLLEETELFVRKSGGELTSKLYSFTDPAGTRVSLRPEFTSSVIRYFVQERGSLSLPARLQYGGPVFRYDSSEVAGYRQFTQAGAELVGAGGVEADAEILILALEGLARIGLKGHSLRIGHLKVLKGVLDSRGLSESATQFIIGNASALKAGSEDASSLRAKAERVGLLSAGPERADGVAVSGQSGKASRALMEDVLEESMPTPIGRRTTQQIVARLLRKTYQVDDPATFEDAVGLATELARVEGSPEHVLEEARRVADKWGVSGDPMEGLDSLARLLERDIPSTQLTFDMGIARGFGYYTGIIFEMTLPGPNGPISLGSGGRYDVLVRALGGSEDVPALGFAYHVDRAVDAADSAHSAGGA